MTTKPALGDDASDERRGAQEDVDAFSGMSRPAKPTTADRSPQGRVRAAGQR
jgi:hypothetical protein